MVLGVLVAAAVGIHADQLVPDDTIAAAHEAGDDPVAVQGALNSLADAGILTDARTYLIAAGDLAPPPLPVAPASPSGWPFGGAIGARIYCVEGIESHHGMAMFNPTPWYGEHAQGWLGWLPSTARSVGVIIGNRTSEWAGAARMLALGRGREFFGVAAGIC
jgi:hypothetical protein